MDMKTKNNDQWLQYQLSLWSNFKKMGLIILKFDYLIICLFVYSYTNNCSIDLNTTQWDVSKNKLVILNFNNYILNIIFFDCYFS